jgi:hypothetical protein
LLLRRIERRMAFSIKYAAAIMNRPTSHRSTRRKSGLRETSFMHRISERPGNKATLALDAGAIHAPRTG